MWFTSEVMNLLRDLLVQEIPAAGGGSNGLRLWHGAAPEWRAGSGLSMRGMPTRSGTAISVETHWAADRSSFTLTIHGAVQAWGVEGEPLHFILYVGSCYTVDATIGGSATVVGGSPSARCGHGRDSGVVSLRLLPSAGPVVVDVAVRHAGIES